MTDQKNTLIAIVLSALVLIGWQIFFGLPQVEKQKQIQQQQAQERALPAPGTPAQQQSGTPPQPTPGTAPQAPGQPSTVPGQTVTREAALAASPRIQLDTPRLAGSVSLKGGRLDDLSLVKYRETVDPNSPAIVLLAPSGSPQPFYSEFGWVAGAGTTVKMPGPDTIWRQEGSGALTIDHPVTLAYDNGDGLEFRRTIAVDDKYLFTIRDEVANKSAATVTLYPYALISRHGTPHTLGYYILHEGLVGVMGDQGLKEETYAKIEEKKSETFDVTNAWLGITDKYWAATLLPDTDAKVR
ncbi:MAG: YidC/Oxa1 family rane protein insertase, partial [Alphaproteobacteria bacterium]|nr:YidC/Oxa1 family rane protein insertase [Alphaproteobacteria bacterium]